MSETVSISHEYNRVSDLSREESKKSVKLDPCEAAIVDVKHEIVTGEIGNVRV